MNKKQVSDRHEDIIEKYKLDTLVLAALVIATGMATAATFNLPGMANLSDSIDDMVATIPKIIPLVAVGAIILIVIFLWLCSYNSDSFRCIR